MEFQGKELEDGRVGCGWMAGCFVRADFLVDHPVGLIAACSGCVARFGLDAAGELVSDV